MGGGGERKRSPGSLKSSGDRIIWQGFYLHLYSSLFPSSSSLTPGRRKKKNKNTDPRVFHPSSQFSLLGGDDVICWGKRGLRKKKKRFRVT